MNVAAIAAAAAEAEEAEAALHSARKQTQQQSGGDSPTDGY